MRWPQALLLLAALWGPACRKVPIFGVNASFSLADTAWFAEEETLFVFYQVNAEQGLGDPSLIEITYLTDAERVDWTPLSELVPVHTHLDVDCGVNSLCGSMSIHVPLQPREVRLRLRYHKEGELALNPKTINNIVGLGQPYSNRSFIVYGVFDQTNRYVQWRGRHQFPTVRNQRAERLGLRRDFSVEDVSYGDGRLSKNNVYNYGTDCPLSFEPTGQSPLQTSDRAAFHPVPVPPEAGSAAVLCGQSTVIDGKGTFTAGAIAQKNPEVQAAFPLLRTPVHDAVRLKFYLSPCERQISADHEAMVRQRLQLEDVATTCIDDWKSVGFVNGLTTLFREAMEAKRLQGDDMVFVIGLIEDDPQVASKVEEALAQIVPAERHRSSPRVAGAFLLDSDSRSLTIDGMSQATLWCPAPFLTDQIPDASARSCPTMPDIPDLDLGPFTFGLLPILPTRSEYLDFIDTFSKAQAGEVLELEFLTPEFTTTSDHVDFDEFGVITFINGENFATDDDDAFSYCATDDFTPFVVRSELMQDDDLNGAVMELCASGQLPPELCAYAGLGVLPVELIGDWHDLVGGGNYQVGLFWDFPFLLRMQYKMVVAGSVTAVGFSVPFGIGSTEESYLGTEMWLEDSFSMEELLTQCTRFCDHSTFGPAGIYRITEPFRGTYNQSCYDPLYPAPGDGGFPRDP